MNSTKNLLDFYQKKWFFLKSIQRNINGGVNTVFNESEPIKLCFPSLIILGRD